MYDDIIEDYTKKDYAFEWYSYGLAHEDDAIIKFVLHWIAFNWRYKTMATLPKFQNRRNKPSEKDLINEFCDMYFEKLQNYDAFSTPEFDIFNEGAVYSYKAEEGNKFEEQCDNNFKALKTSKGKDRVKALFNTLYVVRNNLFHGSKALKNPRDVKLVQSSSIILEGYLKEVIKDARFI